MKIFYLHENPALSAQQYCDKHLIQAVLETGQILSTVLHKAKYVDPLLYKPTFHSHPSVHWASKSLANFKWTHELFKALAAEFTFRFGKEHKTWLRLRVPLEVAVRSGTYTDRNSYVNPSYGNNYTWSFCPFFPPPQMVTTKYMVKRGFGIRDRQTGSGAELDNKYEYQSLTTIMAFRRFYIHEMPNSVWTKRSPPEWYVTHDLNDIMNRMLELEQQAGVIDTSATLGRGVIINNGEPIYEKNFFVPVRRFWRRSAPIVTGDYHSASALPNVDSRRFTISAWNRQGIISPDLIFTRPRPLGQAQIINDTIRPFPQMETTNHQEDALRLTATMNWGTTVINPATMVMTSI